MDGEPLGLRSQREAAGGAGGGTGSPPGHPSLRNSAPSVSPTAHLILPSQATHTQREYSVASAEVTATVSGDGEDVEMADAPAGAAVTTPDNTPSRSPPRGDDNPQPAAGDTEPASSTQARPRYQVVDTARLRELDEAFNRIPDGSSIREVDAVFLEENSRTYHSYKQGAYWLPNDPVRRHPKVQAHSFFACHALFPGHPELLTRQI
jgi:hypothetical protein